MTGPLPDHPVDAPEPTPGEASGLTVLAVDDERPALDDLAYLLRHNPNVAAVHTADTAQQALRLLRSVDVDAVFLDIRLPGLTGLELAAVLARFAHPPCVVFVTAYDEHAVGAFDVGALDYVMKPVRAERLAEAVRRIADAVQATAITGGAGRGAGNDESLIPVELAGTVRFVHRRDVQFVEAQGDYARLHTPTGNHLVRVPLTTLEERWEPVGFVRVHRSYLVNIRHIEELRFEAGHYTVLLGGRELPVSRRHSRHLKDRLVRGARPGGSPGHP